MIMSVLSRIEVVRGDITRLSAEAIVNATNSSLMGGGGVYGAIHRAGGIAILEDCIRWVNARGHCRTGDAVATTAGRLPAKKVIHTVGPVWKDGNLREDELLASCYQTSLRLAVDHGCTSIAFPSISTGVFGFPRQRAASVAVAAIADFLGKDDFINMVYLACLEADDYDCTHTAITRFFSTNETPASGQRDGG